MAGTPSIDQSALRLQAFATDARSLSVEAFADQHGQAFLLFSGGAQALRPQSSSEKTITGGGAGRDRPGFKPNQDFLVFPLINRRSSSSGTISVGRTPRADVVIPDGSLTRVQAFFRQAGDDFSLADAASKNGTWVDDRPAPPWSNDEWLPIPSGARIRMGDLRMTFLTAGPFVELVVRLT